MWATELKRGGQERRAADSSLPLRLSFLMVCDKASDPSSLDEWFIHQNSATQALFALRRWQINYGALSSPCLVRMETLLSHWCASYWKWRKWAGCSLTLFIWICIAGIVKSRAGVIVKCSAENREPIRSSSCNQVGTKSSAHKCTSQIGLLSNHYRLIWFQKASRVFAANILCLSQLCGRFIANETDRQQQIHKNLS